MKQELLLLTDYRKQFYEAVRSRGASLDVDRMGRYFADKGYRLSVKQFREVDFRATDHKGVMVLYQSSEDRGLLYKDYIEDILLGLMLQGAILIPDFIKFRAHHNKVFMEILRSVSGSQGGSGSRILSKGYGTYEEFEQDTVFQAENLVMKPASGARSAGVRLVKGRPAQLKYARRLSSSFHLMDYLKIKINSFIRKDYRRKSWHRRKFLVQEHVPGLEGDYKVLVYGKKIYVLHRKNRKNDFRASGSGIFTYPATPPPGLLDYAFDVFSSFHVPFVSLDIARHGAGYVLIEFQFLSFGNYTLERSSFHFTRTDKHTWEKVEEAPDLEREFVNSVIGFVEANYMQP
jgi:hypothetical protein